MRAPGDQQVFHREACRGAGCWAGGSVGVHMLLFFFSSPRVPYLAVARAFEKIEEVSAR